jgi:hypothetical protein
MKLLRIWITVALLAWATPVLAETIHLKGGETIKGRIIGITNDTITIESEKGYGVLQVPRKEVLLIEYQDDARDPSRTIGLGYQHESAPVSGNGASTAYGLDALSLKYWLDKTDSVDIQFGFFSAINDSSKDLEIFSLEVRYAHVFKRQSELDLYYGGSLGYLAVKDKSTDPNLDDAGFGVKAFLGAEIFFVTLPNLGLAAEVGIGTQQVGSRSTTSITTTSFPTLSARYYF